MSEARSKMARMPEGATALDNRIGGAPGAMIHEGDSTIFCLPGVPSELKFIFEDSIVQWITQRVTKGFFEEVVQFRMHDESVFAPFIDIVMEKHPGVYVKSMPQTYGTTKTLRVWISAREEELSASKAKVRDAIRSLEEATGLSSSAIDE